MTAPSAPTPPDGGRDRARRQLAELTADYGQPPRLGCRLTSHRDLGFCSSCIRPTPPLGPTGVELYAWQLLSIAERGVPEQPTREEPSR